MNTNLRNIIGGIGFVVVVFAAGIFYLAHRNEEAYRQPVSKSVTMAAAQPVPNPGVDKIAEGTSSQIPIVRSEAILAIPLGDDRVLMGASHNVFVGKVVGQVGMRVADIGAGRTFPITQFSVEPILNIKGNLQGIVTVEQAGGYQDGALYVSGEGDGDMFGPSSGPGAGYLMQPGLTYLFATRYESDGTYYLWEFPTASKLISQNSAVSNNQLQALAESDARVQQLQAAYPHEILVADDVRTGNTRNSYISTHPILAPAPPPPSAPSSTEELNPPVISGLTSVVASSSVTISWTTNKPATSQLLFGSSTAMAANMTPDANLVTTHSEHISGLAPGTTYYFEVQAKDTSGKTSNSAEQTFTTSGQSEAAPSAEPSASVSASTSTAN